MNMNLEKIKGMANGQGDGWVGNRTTNLGVTIHKHEMCPAILPDKYREILVTL